MPPSNSDGISRPVFIFVLPIRLTTTSRLTSGRPLQFSVMWQNIRCSILFHLLVPGGKWHTEMLSPISSASRCNSTFHSRPITLELVKDALKDLLSVNRGQVSVENIQKTVADFYKIKVADMYSKRRPANIALPRQIAMYLAKELTQKSLPEIGELFGGRDHTTVLHAVRKISGERQQLTELNQQLHVLEQTLKG